MRDFSRFFFGDDFAGQVRRLNLISISKSTAYRRHDANIRRPVERRLQDFIAADNTAVDENVYVLADLALFCEHSVAQAAVPAPKLVQRLTNSCWVGIHADFGFAAAEFR